jgi:CO/xanthine dehydrogenase FAD-binding subunit
MITEYHCPDTIEAALALLSRPNPKTVPLAGGTTLSLEVSANLAVVDLQKLGLDFITRNNNTLEVGATTALQALVESDLVPDALHNSLQDDNGANIRQKATIGGAVVSSDGRSSFLTGLLALNVLVVWLPAYEEIPLGDYLALRHTWDASRCIHSFKIPLTGTLKMESVARSPKDLPIVCVAVCRWSSGRTRVVLGGYGKSPVLAMDGPEAAGSAQAAASAYLMAGDAWASAEYRSAVASDLVRRILSEFSA